MGASFRNGKLETFKLVKCLSKDGITILDYLSPDLLCVFGEGGLIRYAIYGPDF